jgi:hypothetical protein
VAEVLGDLFFVCWSRSVGGRFELLGAGFVVV